MLLLTSCHTGGRLRSLPCRGGAAPSLPPPPPPPPAWGRGGRGGGGEGGSGAGVRAGRRQSGWGCGRRRADGGGGACAGSRPRAHVVGLVLVNLRVRELLGHVAGVVNGGGVVLAVPEGRARRRGGHRQGAGRAGQGPEPGRPGGPHPPAAPHVQVKRGPRPPGAPGQPAQDAQKSHHGVASSRLSATSCGKLLHFSHESH